MSLLIKTAATVPNPVAIDFANVPNALGHWIFGKNTTSSLTNRVNGVVNSNSDKLTVSETGAVVTTKFNLDTAITTAQTGIFIFNADAVTSESKYTKFDLLGDDFNYITLRGIHYNDNSSRNLALRYGASTSYDIATVENNLYFGNVFAVVTYNISTKLITLHYFVNGVRNTITLELTTLNPTGIKPFINTNSGNKHYEHAFFSSILSDADIEKYYATMKKVYARKGITIN